VSCLVRQRAVVAATLGCRGKSRGKIVERMAESPDKGRGRAWKKVCTGNLQEAASCPMRPADHCELLRRGGKSGDSNR
jgi:hypothetical protein